jgi:hypothetical protein
LIYPDLTWDKVFLDTTNLPIGYANVASTSRKLQHRFAVPFQLGKQHRDNAFRIEDILSHWRIHDVFNVDRFRLDTSDLSRAPKPPPPLRSTARKGEEWEVQEILNHRGAKMADLEYEIKWVGYDELTWEPIEYLKGTSNEFLRKYHQENGLRVYNGWFD